MDAVFGFVSSFMARLVPIQVRAGSPFFHHRFPFLWLGTEDAFHAQDIFLFRAFAVRVDVHVFVDVPPHHVLVSVEAGPALASPTVLRTRFCTTGGDGWKMAPPLHERRMVSMADPSILPSTPSKEPPWDADLALDPWDWKGDAHLPRGNPTRPRRFSNLVHDPLQSETPTDTWWTKGQEGRRGGRRIRPYVQRNATQR